MKKTIIVMGLMLMLIASLVSATSWSKTTGTLDIAEKDSNWDVVEGGAYGNMKLNIVQRQAPYGSSKDWKIVRQTVKLRVYGLEPRTKYQLIYYGNEEVNDVWPYATCLGREFKTGSKGQRSVSARFNHIDASQDEVQQKLWVVLASDVDCELGEMVAWQPSEYLFENNLI